MAKKKKILIIEDNIEICELMEMILSDKYEVSVKNSMDEIVKDFDVSSFNLIISDYLIGNRDAGEVVEMFPEKKYLILTALSSQNPRLKQLISRPNISYMQKPFELNNFTETVESLI